MCSLHKYSHTHTHSFNGPFSGTTQVSRYQKGKTNLDFTEARDSEWQWHQLGYMQVSTSLQTDNHASTPPLSSLQAGCPSCRPTNSVKALKANIQCIWNYAEFDNAWILPYVSFKQTVMVMVVISTDENLTWAPLTLISIDQLPTTTTTV